MTREGIRTVQVVTESPVFATIDGDGPLIEGKYNLTDIHRLNCPNTSDQPAYRVELRWHRGTAGYGEPNPEPVGTIMPGKAITRSRIFLADTNTAVRGVAVTFTDAAGIRWLRRPDGYLSEQE